MKWKKVLSAVLLFALWGGIAFAQAPPDANQYVSKEEYEKLKQEMESLKAEMAEIRKERAVPTVDVKQKQDMEALKTEVTALKEQRAAQSADVNDISAQLQAFKGQAELTRPGTTNFLLTGFGFAGFTDKKHENSTFETGFNPIFLWEINDRLFVEGGLEFSLSSEGQAETSQTETSVEFMDISYILNDYVTIGAGKFPLPVGIFNQRLEAKWINKLPDRPLPYDDDVGIAPEAGIGAFVRGAAPVGPSSKVNYEVYVTNGPALITDNPDRAGMLDFDNFSDNNHNKAVGGRVGYLPIPELEVGYSIQGAKVSPSGFTDVDVLINALDVSYLKQIESIRGTIDARAEFVWSNVDNVTYDPTGASFGPLRFDNDRDGYYVQVAYRPTMVNDKVLKNLEFVMRYDALNVPGSARGALTSAAGRLVSIIG